eukprot:8619456-Pyramimonas_sp.AAC.2
MDVDLLGNTKLPGVAPAMEILKPIPPGPPLPGRHSLDVVDPKNVVDWRAYGALVQHPLRIRVVATGIFEKRCGA